MEELPIDFGSDDEFEGYIAAEDGPDIDAWDETVATPEHLSLSSNDLAVLQDRVGLPLLPLARRSTSLSPMQGQNSSRSQLAHAS